MPTIVIFLFYFRYFLSLVLLLVRFLWMFLGLDPIRCCCVTVWREIYIKGGLGHAHRNCRQFYNDNDGIYH